MNKKEVRLAGYQREHPQDFGEWGPRARGRDGHHTELPLLSQISKKAWAQWERKRRQWAIGVVDDFVDDSIQFIDEELSRLGLSSKQANEARERIKYGLISQWARQALNEYTHCIEGVDFLSERTIRAYLRKKFGLRIPIPRRFVRSGGTAIIINSELSD